MELDEDPWAAAERECREELRARAAASPVSGKHPFFLTVTSTRGAGTHTDVSLWYLLQAKAEDITSFDEGEFAAVRWLTLAELFEEPAETLDPHLHRFGRKLHNALTGQR